MPMTWACVHGRERVSVGLRTHANHPIRARVISYLCYNYLSHWPIVYVPSPPQSNAKQKEYESLCHADIMTANKERDSMLKAMQEAFAIASAKKEEYETKLEAVKEKCAKEITKLKQQPKGEMTVKLTKIEVKMSHLVFIYFPCDVSSILLLSFLTLLTISFFLSFILFFLSFYLPLLLFFFFFFPLFFSFYFFLFFYRLFFLPIFFLPIFFLSIFSFPFFLPLFSRRSKRLAWRRLVYKI